MAIDEAAIGAAPGETEPSGGMASFPGDNPHPVLRLSFDGTLIYANAASRPVLAAVGAAVGSPLPVALADALLRAARSATGDVVEVEAGERTFEILPVIPPGADFVNLYGTDITARKLVDKFPGLNPHPVLRIGDDGRLLYANAAAEPIARLLRASVGRPVPRATLERLRAALGGGALEVRGDGRTYRLQPVDIAGFGFMNVYGIDITAEKAINKFPDANPHPVLRVARDGRLEYANPASAPVVRALGLAVGRPLPADLEARIRSLAAGDGPGRMEIDADGRRYSLLAVAVYEFDVVNLYGTDVTAAYALEQAHRQNERLLLNILPEPIADRLRNGESVIADRFDDLALLFADIVDFTVLSSRLPPSAIVELLNEVFSVFDGLVDAFGLEKIKTIGDAYMVVGGLEPHPEDALVRVAEMALALRSETARLRVGSPHPIDVRIGIQCGPAVAGVIGTKRWIYDVWGDTVNTASRMESHGTPGRIQVTDRVHERLRDRYDFEPRGVIDVRGKGPMATWFLLGPRGSATSA